MKLLLLLLVALLGPSAGLPAADPGFGVMMLQTREPTDAVRIADWARAGRWEWIRLMDSPAADLGTGLCRLLWPAARFEPADFSEEIRTARLSDDPWEIFRSARAALLTNAVPLAYEIGNEPDLYFTPDLPDRMALTLKSAWWAIKSAQPTAAVLMPSLAGRPGPYAEMLAANNLGQFTDGWNLHLYGWAQDFPEALAEHRQFLERHTGVRRPVWVTEIGFAEFPATLPPVPEILLARQRAFFERVTIAAPYSGVSRQWAYVFGPKIEQGQDYGLNEADWSPRPALDALVALTRELRAWRPSFELRRRSDDAVAGYVLARKAPSAADPETWWTLLVSPNRRADFALPEAPGLSGSRQPAAAPETSLFEFRIEFPPGFGPVRLGLNGEHGEITTGGLTFTASAATNLFLRTPAHRFAVAGCEWIPAGSRADRLAEGSPPPHPSPVVISLAWASNAVRPDKAAVAYRYRRGEPVRLTARGDNFGTEAVNGRWRLRLPSGWRLAEGSARTGWMQVPAGGTTIHPFELIPPPAVSSARRQEFAVEWRGDDGRRDVAAAWLAAEPEPEESFSLETLPAGWQPTEPDASWERSELPGGITRLHLAGLRQGVTTGLLLPLPAALRLRSDEVLRLRLRAGDDRSHFRRRLDLITPGRQVFRLGDDWPVDGEWQTLDLRVGDFTPAFWSRADPSGRIGPEAARYFRLGLFGLTAGATVELGPVEIRRPLR